jgi:hypothetical protein
MSKSYTAQAITVRLASTFLTKETRINAVPDGTTYFPNNKSSNSSKTRQSILYHTKTGDLTRSGILRAQIITATKI